MMPHGDINISTSAFKLWLILAAIIFITLIITEKRNKEKSLLSHIGNTLLWAWTIAGTILPVLALFYCVIKWLLKLIGIWK